MVTHIPFPTAYHIGKEHPDYVYAQNVECEDPCEWRLSRTVL